MTVLIGKVLLAADLLGALGALGLSFLINPDKPQIWILFVLTFILNVMSRIHIQQHALSCRMCIKKKSLAGFNAWASAFSTGQALGPLVGGFYYTLID